MSSLEHGVGQPASCAASLMVSCFFVPLGLVRASGSLLVLPPLPLCWSGVGQGASVAVAESIWLRFGRAIQRSIDSGDRLELLSSATCGVGHPPQSLSLVERPDTASRQTSRPRGVTFSLQVIANKVEPPVGNRAFNLLAKHDDRAALADEAKPRRPKVARIVSPMTAARGAEGLAGTTTRPNRSVIRPAGKSEGEGPAADAGEEVALGVVSEVVRLNGLDVSAINVTRCDVSRDNEVAEPLGRERLVLVVVGRHYRHPNSSPSSRSRLTPADSTLRGRAVMRAPLRSP